MAQVKPTILVTGGAGYIGSHAVLALQQSGYEVIVLDNLVNGHRDLVEKVLQVKLIVGDICDRTLLDHLFATYPITAVMHFAAHMAVGESVTHPSKYYQNNVAGTLTLLEAMVAASIKKFVFSSTCALYGVPQSIPITEDHPQNPISPYASTKQMVEQILADFDPAYDLKSVCFRYFNAAGAEPNGRLGGSPISQNLGDPGSNYWASRSITRRSSSGGGSSTTPMRLKSLSRGPSSRRRGPSFRSRWRSACRCGGRVKPRMSRPMVRRAGLVWRRGGRPDFSALTVWCWASSTATTSAMMDRNMCCVSRPLGPARVLASSFLRC